MISMVSIGSRKIRGELHALEDGIAHLPRGLLGLPEGEHGLAVCGVAHVLAQVLRQLKVWLRLFGAAVLCRRLAAGPRPHQPAYHLMCLLHIMTSSPLVTMCWIEAEDALFCERSFLGTRQNRLKPKHKDVTNTGVESEKD